VIAFRELVPNGQDFSLWYRSVEIGISSMTSKQKLVRARELYDNYNFGRFSYSDERHKFNPLLIEFLQSMDKGKTLYDIGCGAGYWFDIYQQFGISKDNIHGLDLAESNVRTLQSAGYDVVCGDATNIQLSDEVSDYTVSSGVIHHTPDTLAAFSEIVRITKPGGFIFINVYNLWHPYYWIVHKLTFPLRFIYWNVTKDIEKLIFPLAYILLYGVSSLIFRRPVDRRTAKILFMDQVMTPRAELFTKRKLSRFANQTGVKAVQFRYNKGYLMLSAIFHRPA